MPRHAPIYVLDDSDAVVAAEAALLETGGYAAFQFTSPTEFLVHCDPRQPGCLVVDLRIPTIDARTFLERVRETHDRLAMVAVTHDAPGDDAATWAAFGVTAVLRKPFDAAHFLTTVKRALEQSASRFGL